MGGWVDEAYLEEDGVEEEDGGTEGVVFGLWVGGWVSGWVGWVEGKKKGA